MISFDDYKLPNGRTDWKAYHKAEEDAGQRCTKCEAFIFPAAGHRTECPQCSGLWKSEEVQHSKLLRCPECGEEFDAFEAIESGDLHRGNDAQVHCVSCDCEFTVKIWVEYTFTSPERKTEESDLISEP